MIKLTAADDTQLFYVDPFRIEAIQAMDRTTTEVTMASGHKHLVKEVPGKVFELKVRAMAKGGTL